MNAQSLPGPAAGNGRRAAVGRITLQPFHVTDALPDDERWAWKAKEAHLWLRYHHRDDNAPLELLPDGSVGDFTTTGHVQMLLRLIGAPKQGEKFAARVKNEIWPRLGLTEKTGWVKKPRVREDRPGQQREEGGRHAQSSELSSKWWPVYRLPTLTRLLSRYRDACPGGAYPSHPGEPRSQVRQLTASLSALLRCQGLIPKRKRRIRGAPGSVQHTFWATGPP